MHTRLLIQWMPNGSAPSPPCYSRVCALRRTRFSMAGSSVRGRISPLSYSCPAMTMPTPAPTPPRAVLLRGACRLCATPAPVPHLPRARLALPLTHHATPAPAPLSRPSARLLHLSSLVSPLPPPRPEMRLQHQPPTDRRGCLQHDRPPPPPLDCMASSRHRRLRLWLRPNGVRDGAIGHGRPFRGCLPLSVPPLHHQC